jgi:uncharacterized protein YjbI with pentapeptide repeats
MKTKALLAYYTQGIHNLLEALGEDHPEKTTILSIQQRLVENLTRASSAEDTQTRAALHAEILDHLNQISIQESGEPFNIYCEVTPQAPAPKEKSPQTSLAAFKQWITPLIFAEDQLAVPGLNKLIQARTLAVLPHLNGNEKGDVIQMLHDAELITSEAPAVSLEGANLTHINLVEANLVDVNLAGVDLSGANLTSASLIGATLTHATMVGANMGWVVLRYAHMHQVELGGANLPGADLRGATLLRSHLIMANLKWANLVETHLEGANLLRTNAEQAVLTSANLTKANLLWTNFTNARLDQVKLADAMYNHHTEWPEDFDPDAAGARSIG